MQNSLGNNDVSTLSPDHTNGVDPIIAERIEVLRGPATLLYGSSNIGGIVKAKKLKSSQNPTLILMDYLRLKP